MNKITGERIFDGLSCKLEIQAFIVCTQASLRNFFYGWNTPESGVSGRTTCPDLSGGSGGEDPGGQERDKITFEQLTSSYLYTSISKKNITITIVMFV
jgi:hypothetical protein